MQKKIMVVEIEKKNINELAEQIDIVKHRCPESLQGRTVDYVCRDMTEHLPELPDQYYDLAYCEDVLYILHLQGGIDAVERGISQMIRVVKPNGFVVAVESKFGAKFKTQKVLGIDMAVPVRMSEPKNMQPLFTSKALRKLDVLGCPPYAYCYQRSSE